MQNSSNQTRLKQKRQSNLWLEGCWFKSTGLASKTDDKFTSVVKPYNLFFISMTKQQKAEKKSSSALKRPMKLWELAKMALRSKNVLTWWIETCARTHMHTNTRRNSVLISCLYFCILSWRISAKQHSGSDKLTNVIFNHNLLGINEMKQWLCVIAFLYKAIFNFPQEKQWWKALAS